MNLNGGGLSSQQAVRNPFKNNLNSEDMEEIELG